MNQLKCNNCDNESFLINGWTITEELIEDDVIEAYDENDVGNVDIVEIICKNCGEPHMTVTGGEI